MSRIIDGDEVIEKLDKSIEAIRKSKEKTEDPFIELRFNLAIETFESFKAFIEELLQ